MLNSLSTYDAKGQGYNNITTDTLKMSLQGLALKHNAFNSKDWQSGTPDVGMQIVYTNDEGTRKLSTRKLFEYAYQYSVLGGQANNPKSPGDHGSGWCTFNSTTTADPLDSHTDDPTSRQFCVNYNNNASYRETGIGCTEGHQPAHLMCSTEYLSGIGAYGPIDIKTGKPSTLPSCDQKFVQDTPPKPLPILCDNTNALCKDYFQGRTIETVQTAPGTYQYPKILDPDMTVKQAMGLKWHEDACDPGSVAVVKPPQLNVCACHATDSELLTYGSDCKDSWQNAVCCAAETAGTKKTGQTTDVCTKLRQDYPNTYEEGCQMCTSANETWRLPNKCPGLKSDTLGKWDSYGEEQICTPL